MHTPLHHAAVTVNNAGEASLRGPCQRLHLRAVRLRPLRRRSRACPDTYATHAGPGILSQPPSLAPFFDGRQQHLRLARVVNGGCARPCPDFQNKGRFSIYASVTAVFDVARVFQSWK